MLSQLAQLRSWANGRDVIAFSHTVIEHVYARDKSRAGLKSDKEV